MVKSRGGSYGLFLELNKLSSTGLPHSEVVDGVEVVVRCVDEVVSTAVPQTEDEVVAAVETDCPEEFFLVDGGFHSFLASPRPIGGPMVLLIRC